MEKFRKNCEKLNLKKTVRKSTKIAKNWTRKLWKKLAKSGGKLENGK